MTVQSENPEEGEKWDKIKTWESVQSDIHQRLKEPEKYDQSMTLNHGPQLYHTFRHTAHIKCMTHFTSTAGDNFVTHYRIGTVDHLSVWSLESKERDAVCKHDRYTIHAEITCLLHIPYHKVYFGFGSDLVMRMYTDARSQCQEVGDIQCDTTILCMAFCKESNAVFAGGIGTLEKWKVKGSEHSATFSRGEKFDIDMKPEEWVIDIKVDPRNKQLLALTHDGIYVANLQTLKQTHHLQNRHDGSLKCCAFYKEREYFITGGGDGLVKVWNAVVFSQVHIFYGHRGAITALQVHKADPLLFSSSMDGTVQIWRMDNFSKFMRVDLGEPVYQMKLLGSEEFFCQTEKEIKIYNLNQFYQLFAPVESSVYKLQLCSGAKGKPSRILCSTEDGSVRFFSPTSGATITIIYPMPTFQVLTSFAYCREKERLMTILENGDVLVFNCETNPCKAEEIWQAGSHDEEVTSLVLVSLIYEGIEGSTVRDSVVFGGLRNGQISLMDATNCVMVKNVQAHEGAIVCMEHTTEIDGSGFQVMETSRTIVTGGDDSFLKMWNIVVVPGHTGDQISLEVILKIHCSSPPLYISMYENTLCLTLRGGRPGSCMQMYRLDSSDPGDPSAPLQYTQLHHAADEDHTDQITAVDKCPLLGLFVTSGVDGYIKVWNRHNQLLREMEFGEPLFGVCFANPRGDLLLGFQNHVCLIPLTSFFPQNYLERIALQSFKDEAKENLIQYNPNVKPWFDPRRLPKYSTSLSSRTQEKNQPEPEEILEDLEDKDEEKEEERLRKFEAERTIIEEGIKRRLEQRRRSRARESRGAEPTFYREETDATSILGSPLQLEDLGSTPTPSPVPITKLHRAGSITPRPGAESVTPRTGSILKVPSRLGEERRLSQTATPDGSTVDADFEFDVETPRSQKKAKKMVKFEKKEEKKYSNLHLLSPLERALLKRRPIIALDGYIPNSVIRKQLGYRPPTPPLSTRSKDVWTPKPVPVAKPRHTPGYKEEEESMDLYEIAARFKMYLSDSDEESTFHLSDSEEDVNERPCHGQKRNKRKKKKEREFSDDGWSDGDDDLEGDENDEVNDDLLDDLDDETSVEVAESLIGTEFSLLGEGKSLKDQKPFVWGELPEPIKTPVQPFKKLGNMVRTVSNLSSTSSKRQFKPQSRRSTPGTPSKYELKSRAFQFGGMELGLGLGTPDSLRGSRSKSGGPQSRERTKSFNLTNMVVDENSTNVKFKEESKGKRKVPSDMDVIHKLLKEDFFRDVKGASPSFDSILQRLLTMLDTEDAEEHSKICEYILDLHKDIGISEHYLDRFINKLSHQMNNGGGNLNIRKNGLTALSVIGKSRQDVVASILPRLVDGNRELREEAAAAMATLTGVTTKDDLFKLMEDMGLQSTYNSKEDEEEALKALATRLDVPYRSDSFNDWIEGWMTDIQSPAMMEEEDLKLHDIEKAWGGREQRWVPESLYISDATSRASNRLRELSFISDKSLFEEDRLSFLSFDSERDDDFEYDSTEELKYEDEIEAETAEVPAVLRLQIGDQILEVTRNVGEVLADDDPDAMFAKLYDTDDENFTKQMAVIDKILDENPDFQLTDFKYDSEASIVGVLTSKDGHVGDRGNVRKIPSTITERTENNTMDVRSSRHSEVLMDNVSGKWTPAGEKHDKAKAIPEETHVKDLEAPPSSRASSKRSRRTRFDPRDPAMYKYYRKRNALRPGSGRPRERNGVIATGSLHKLSSYSEEADSQLASQDYTDASSSQVGDGSTDVMSMQDSGIVRDMSVSVTSQSSKGAPVSVRFSTQALKKAGEKQSKEWVGLTKSRLSPVKSSGSLQAQHGLFVSKAGRSEGDWQKFFNTPTALERKRMEMVRRDFTEGKMKQHVAPTIQYISDDLPKLPGEAGLRLLHTVKVGDKTMEGMLEKHRVEPIPGKLSSQTKNENEGQSQYGILKMKWTTEIPIPLRALEPEYSDRDSIYSGSLSTASHYSVSYKKPHNSETHDITTDRSHGQIIQSDRSQQGDKHTPRSRDQKKEGSKKSRDSHARKSHGRKSRLPQLAEKYASKSKPDISKSKESEFWTFPTLPGAVAPSPDFIWDYPIPPPPERESRTTVPYIKKEHEKYCKYYSLIRKNLQHYTSPRDGSTPKLPQIEVTKALLPSSTDKKLELSRGPSLVFPPVTLNQLISAR